MINKHGPGCLLFKCDIRCCYRWIPVDPHDYHLLGFHWRDQLYFDTKLPFGLRSSAMACQRCTNALVYIYQKSGFDAINYIDDFASAETTPRAAQAFSTLKNVITTHGFTLAQEKSTPPTTNLIFLGKQFDTTTMTISIPFAKLREVRDLLNLFSSKKKCTKRQLQSCTHWEISVRS
ncbi:uncharacterized protein LOC144451315 [Glandiceps talaboti]